MSAVNSFSKRRLRNQQKGRRQRQRLTTTQSSSSPSNATCTTSPDAHDMSIPMLLPCIAGLPPNMHNDTATVRDTNSTVISPVHTGKRNKNYVRPPPSTQETTDNLDVSLHAVLSAQQSAYKTSLADFERNHNVHTPPQHALPTGDEIEEKAYEFHYGQRWTKDEEKCLYEATKYVLEHPVARKKGERKTNIWKRVQMKMGSSRSADAISTHFSNIVNNKMKEAHPRFSEFCKLKTSMDQSKMEESDSTRKAMVNRYTALLDGKAKSKAEKKRDKMAKQEKLEENVNTVCELFKMEMTQNGASTLHQKESDTQWRRRNIMEIRNGLDSIAANKENNILTDDAQKLQKALLSTDGAEHMVIEYERLKQKKLSTQTIMVKLMQ